MRIILATNNTGKITELQSILTEFECIPQQELGIQDAAETGQSFIENAIIKARHASQAAKRPALADDSGLVVMALKGQPGIFSARFAGEHATSMQNINLLLARLAQVPSNERQAYFYCAIAFVKHATDPTPVIATGQCFGEISQSAIGDNGFGYDPVFYLPEHHCTFAQLPTDIKNTISHRARALNQLRAQLNL